MKRNGLVVSYACHLSCSFFVPDGAELNALCVAYVPSAVTSFCTDPCVIAMSSSGASPAALRISSSTMGIWEGSKKHSDGELHTCRYLERFFHRAKCKVIYIFHKIFCRSFKWDFLMHRDWAGKGIEKQLTSPMLCLMRVMTFWISSVEVQYSPRIHMAARWILKHTTNKWERDKRPEKQCCDGK